MVTDFGSSAAHVAMAGMRNRLNCWLDQTRTGACTWKKLKRDWYAERVIGPIPRSRRSSSRPRIILWAGWCKPVQDVRPRACLVLCELSLCCRITFHYYPSCTVGSFIPFH